MSSKRGVVLTDATGENIRIRLRGEDSAGHLAVIEEVVAADFELYFEWLAAQQAGVEPPHERPASGQYTRVVGPQIG